MIEYLSTHKWSILQILVYILIFYFIYGATILYYNSKYIKDNWNKYKCRPYVIPIAGFFGKDPFSNFSECTTNIFKEYFNILILPIESLFITISKTLINITNTLNIFRKMAYILRELFNKIVMQILTKIQNHLAATQFFGEKFKTIMRQQYIVFQMVYYYLEALRMSFDSFLNGPTPILLIFLMMFGLLTMFLMSMCLMCPIPIIGIFACPICMMCFSSDTIINGVNISKIKLGSYLENDNKVLVTYKFKTDNMFFLYNYKGIDLTGSHLLLDNNDPRRVIDDSDSKFSKITNTVYCLSTSKHIININGIPFSDYTECSNIELDRGINNLILSKLNNIKIIDDTYESYIAGFADIKIPKNNSVIKALILDNNVKLYNYNGVICSGNCIVYENDKWIRVYKSNIAIYLEAHNYKYIYHTTSDNGVIKINGNLFRDFIECYDVQDQIHNKSIEYIRLKYL
jgi:hypothetical protein